MYDKLMIMRIKSVKCNVGFTAWILVEPFALAHFPRQCEQSTWNALRSLDIADTSFLEAKSFGMGQSRS
jgi:hypothetical protein